MERCFYTYSARISNSMDIHIFLSFFPPPLGKNLAKRAEAYKNFKADGFFFFPARLIYSSGIVRHVRSFKEKGRWGKDEVKGIRQERIITDEESDRVWGRKVSRQIVKMSETTIFKNEEVRQVPRERMSCRIASKSHGCDVGGLLLPPFCKVLPPALPALVVYSDSFLCIGR